MHYSVYVLFWRVCEPMRDAVASAIERLAVKLPEGGVAVNRQNADGMTFRWDGPMEAAAELSLKHELRESVESLGLPLEMDYVAYNHDDSTMSTVHIAPDQLYSKTNTFVLRHNQTLKGE